MNYKQLEDAVKAVIKENGNEEITGELLQAVLLTMIRSLGTGYQFMGVATSETEPGTPDQKVFYFFYAQEETELANFGLTVGAGLSVLLWGTEWTAQTIEIGGGVESLIVPTTWADLKALRDAGELIPGMRYRITDYVATTTQENTRSANHPFDIIVVADSANTLNENATAIQHEGDTYFANSDLAAWKLKYCLDNDASRFIWADNRLLPAWIASPDVLNGEHLPYQGMHTIDGAEAVGELPIYGTQEQAVRESGMEGAIGWCCWDSEEGLLVYPSSRASGLAFLTDDYTIEETYAAELEFTPNTPELGKGVIYKMTDEFANKVGFDFKGIQFKRYQVLRSNMVYDAAYVSQEKAVIYANTLAANINAYKYQLYGFPYPKYGGSAFSSYFEEPSAQIDDSAIYISLDDPEWVTDIHIICKIEENSFGWFFLFNSETEEATDWSLAGKDNGVLNNDISKIKELPSTIFFGDDCYSNTFENKCLSNTFGNHCHSNTFGENCLCNTFGTGCLDNTIGGSFKYNVLGGQCNHNTFGHNCYNNIFGAGCNYNTFGHDCYNNIMQNGCYDNTFGAECYSNYLGVNCKYNTFGIGCGDNTFETPTGVQYCIVTSGVNGEQIPFIALSESAQIACYKQDGTLVVKFIAEAFSS